MKTCKRPADSGLIRKSTGESSKWQCRAKIVVSFPNNTFRIINVTLLLTLVRLHDNDNNNDNKKLNY